MNAFDFLVHNFDYDDVIEDYYSELVRFGSQALHEDLK